MLGLRLHEWGGTLRWEEMPIPKPAGGEVLVRVRACGVGLTVLNCMRGELGNQPDDLPRVPGHEVIGTIAEVGEGVSRERLGEQVFAYFYLCCGECGHCRAGNESMCERLAGNLGVHRDGGYAPWAAIPALNALPLPTGLDPVVATTIPDAIATPVHVARRAAIHMGDRVAVVGAGGGVGVHMVQVARVRGADVVGLEVDAAKLRFLSDDLRIAVSDSSDFDAVVLPEHWGSGGPDVVVDLLGTEASLAWGLRTLAPEGRLVTLTTFRGVSIPLSPREIVFRQISIIGSRYAARNELRMAAAMVADGRVRPVVGRQVGPSDIDSLHDDLRSGRLLGRGALVWDAG